MKSTPSGALALLCGELPLSFGAVLRFSPSLRSARLSPPSFPSPSCTYPFLPSRRASPEAAARSASFTTLSISHVGPPAPEQKSTKVYSLMESPRSACSLRATSVAGLQGCKSGMRRVQRRVSADWTWMRRRGGNLFR